MRNAYSLYFLTAFCCLTAPALAADQPITVMEVSGKVLVTTADGFVPLEVGQVVTEGSSIFVGDEATARLAKTDGACDVVLPSKKITVISAQKLCDVKITPTASDVTASGLPPVAVGLTFFAAALGTAAIASSSSDRSVSAP